MIKGDFKRDSSENLTIRMGGFTKDAKIGVRLNIGYNGANLYRNATADFVGNHQMVWNYTDHDITLYSRWIIKPNAIH